VTLSPVRLDVATGALVLVTHRRQDTVLPRELRDRTSDDLTSDARLVATPRREPSGQGPRPSPLAGTQGRLARVLDRPGTPA
jgi:hypothetical protein